MKKILLLILFICSFFFLRVPGPAYAERVADLQINSEAAILVDAKSGAVLFKKNEKKQMYPASLTKIATAIYAIENGNLDAIVTISKNAAEAPGSSVYLAEGEKVPLNKLIQGMLINSGNDAAVAIAEHLDDNVEQFSSQLNEYLQKRIKVNRTHFANPNGLFAENHVTTAEDLAKITNYALKNETFRMIYGTKELEWKGTSWDTILLTHHRMLKGEIPFETVTGGKTGYVPKAKFTLATTAEHNEMELTAIVLKGNNQQAVYDDTKRLLDFGYKHFRSSAISKDKRFRTNGKLYTTGGKEIFITTPKQSFTETINHQGLLQIIAADGSVIQTIQLSETQKKAMSANLKNIDANKEEIRMSSDYGRYTALFLLLILIVFGVRKKVKG